MDHFEQRFRTLLSQMLDAELSAAEADELAHLCEADPSRSELIRIELELAELIRHAARDVALEGATFSRRFAAQVGDEPETGSPELIEKLLAGELDDAGVEQLVAHCWRDEAAAETLRRALIQDDFISQSASPARSGEAFIDALATRMWAEQEEDHFVEDVASKIVRMHPELPPAPVLSRAVEDVVVRPSVFAYLGGWSAAAAAVVALGMAILFQPTPSKQVTSVAEVSRAVGDVEWSEAGSPIEAQYFVPGSYALKSGVVTVAFASGAELTVEGPAEFEVRGEREAFVHSGIAVLAKNSAISGPGGGFKLETEALNVGESGETIGLIADGSSSAEAVVFDGGAEICMPELGFCREMFALEPVRADLNREKLFDIPYNPSAFARTWEVTAGVEGNTGPVRMVMPGQKPEPSGKSSEVQVMVEKTRFIAKGDIEVDTLDPGHFASISAGGGRKLASGGRELRSYLLQLTPDGAVPVAGAPGNEALEASVTFDHEIVGIIYSPERLADSDSMVGSVVERFDTVGSLTVADSESGDQILLSDDRRTVNLKLRNGGADQLDQVRVLVALR
ncbi:MAG: hypothetical protein KDN20_03890 [Verrucomicrobiae bacterium]|nr:hypothetical protein [Verrucomicrobiae bacterium]